MSNSNESSCRGNMSWKSAITFTFAELNPTSDIKAMMETIQTNSTFDINTQIWFFLPKEKTWRYQFSKWLKFSLSHFSAFLFRRISRAEVKQSIKVYRVRKKFCDVLPWITSLLEAETRRTGNFQRIFFRIHSISRFRCTTHRKYHFNCLSTDLN